MGTLVSKINIVLYVSNCQKFEFSFVASHFCRFSGYSKRMTCYNSLSSSTIFSYHIKSIDWQDMFEDETLLSVSNFACHMLFVVSIFPFVDIDSKVKGGLFGLCYPALQWNTTGNVIIHFSLR